MISLLSQCFFNQFSRMSNLKVNGWGQRVGLRAMIGRICVVETSTTYRIVLKSRFQRAHYGVDLFGGLDEAIGKLEDLQPDIVLMDLGGRNDELRAFVRSLHAVSANRMVPLLAFVDNATPDEVQRAIALGACDVISRNDDASIAVARAGLHLRRFRELQQLHHHCSGVVDIAQHRLLKPHSTPVVAQRETDARRWTDALQPHLPVHPQSLSSALTEQSDQFDAGARLLVASASPHEATLANLAALQTVRGAEAKKTLVLFSEQDRGLRTVALEMGADDVALTSDDPSTIALRLNLLSWASQYRARLQALVSDGLEMALRDPLTGLHNRRYVDAHWPDLARQAKSGTPVTLLMLDVDHFKSVNDRFGHATGDVVLGEVARTLRAHLRERDMLARVGGEEFLVALPDTGLHCAMETADRLRHAVQGLRFFGAGQSEKFGITISIGVATSDPADRQTNLIDEADRALLRAKFEGRNRTCVSDRIAA